MASYYQRRQVLEEDNVRIKKARHQLDESIAEDQASLLEVTRLISDLEKQIEVAKLQSSQAAHSRKENLERLDAVLARLEEAKNELAQKQETLKALQQKLTENRQQQEEIGKNWPTTKKIRNKSLSIYESSMSRFCRWRLKIE